MANIHNTNNIKSKARNILLSGNGTKITKDSVGGLFIEIAGRIPDGNNKREIKEALLNLGNFLKNKNNSIDLRGKLLTKFGRYGNKTTKITKKTLQIAKRLKEINESNEKIGNIVENNTEIGVNNVKNNNTLPTRAQLLYYIIFYILKILKLNKSSTPISPTEEVPVKENNWEFAFNRRVANVMNVLETVK